MSSNNAFEVILDLFVSTTRTMHVQCIVRVVLTNKSNMASYFPEAGNLNGSNADLCSDVAGPSSRGSGDLFELSDRSNKTIILVFPPLLALLATVLYLSVNTTPILPVKARSNFI